MIFLWTIIIKVKLFFESQKFMNIQLTLMAVCLG
jgi:hypothetical protein